MIERWESRRGRSAKDPKEYFENLCNVDTEERVQYMCVALMVLKGVIILKESHCPGLY